MIARTRGDVQLPYWYKGVRLLCTKAIRQKGSGAQFPKRCPCGKRVPLFKLETGRSFPTGPLGETGDQEFELETGYRFPSRPVPETHIPESPLKLGRSFPGRPPPETASHLEGQNWDAVSGPGIKTKLRWNSSCLGVQPTNTGTIPPQLTRAGKMPALATKCHLRGLGGHSQRHVTEAHISYGIPSSTDTRCPAGLPSNEARRSLRQSAQCRQSADTAK